MAISRGTTFTPDPEVVKKEKEKPQSPVAVIEKNPMFDTISFDKHKFPSKSSLEASLGLRR